MALTLKRVAKLLRQGVAGRHFHRHGLYLDIEHKTNAYWLKRYQLNGRSHYLGLGSAFLFSLHEAEERNRRMSQQLADGIDPLAERKAQKAKAAATPEVLVFAEAAQRYSEAYEAGWSNPKHRAQFLSTLRQYAFPKIGAVDVAALNTPHVLAVLEQKIPAFKNYPAGVFWQVRLKTADRVRKRIGLVIDWAGVRGHRPAGAPNPASWEILRHVLPAPSQVARTTHHRAAPYVEVPAIRAQLATQIGTAAQALSFTLLTGARAGETLGATYGEIDFPNAMWVIPSGRMKARREHRVPLAPEVIELLNALPREAGNPHLFIGARPGSRLSETAMAAALKRAGCDATVHGFRSSFSDWAHERTGFSNHEIELSLAHSPGNAVEKAYRRGMFDRRRKLMEAWARFCMTPQRAGAVVPMRGHRGAR